MKTDGSCGIVAEKMFSSFMKTVSDFVRIGTFYYLYRVLPIGRTIAMAHTNHRGDAFESSR